MFPCASEESTLASEHSTGWMTPTLLVQWAANYPIQLKSLLQFVHLPIDNAYNYFQSYATL